MAYVDPRDEENQLAPEIILGARQLRNPEGIAPRMDTEGPPPTRMPKGAKLEPIPTHSDAKMNIDNVDPAHAMEQPGMVREASTMPAGLVPTPMEHAGEPQAPPDTSALPVSSNKPPQQTVPQHPGGLHAGFQDRLGEYGRVKSDIRAGYMRSPDSFGDPNEYNDYLKNLQMHEGAVNHAEAADKLENPWGSMDNHPGLAGKIGHAFGNIGNAAGQAFAPGLTEAIPGSKMNLENQEQQGTAAIEQGVKDTAALAGAGQKTAAAGKAKEQATTEANKRAELDARATKEQAQTNVIESTGGKKFEKLSDNSIVEIAPNPDGSFSAKPIYKGDPKGKTAFRQLEINGKPHDVLVDANTGATIHDLGEAVPKPQAAGADRGITLIDPTGKVIRATPGTQVTEGTQTPSGYAELGRPTTQMRGMSEMANTVLQQVPALKDQVTKLKDELGPAVGRWNELWVNKGGLDDPKFAGLDTDLDLFASALVRTHFGARGGQQYREELRKQFREAQSPDDLISRIDHAEGWIEGYAHAGKNPIKGETAAPAGGARPSVADWLKSRKGPK